MGTLAIYIYCIPVNHVKQLHMCPIILVSFALQTLSIGYQNHFHNVGIQYVKYLTHTFCVCVCVFVLVLFQWCCFRARDLIVSWFMTAQGYLLGWLGDLTSTVSSCQLSGYVCCLVNLCA